MGKSGKGEKRSQYSELKKIAVYILTSLLVLSLSACFTNQEDTLQAIEEANQETKQEVTQSTDEAIEEAMFGDEELLSAVVTATNEEIELQGIELSSQLEAVEITNEADTSSQLQSQAVLPGADGYVVLYRQNAAGTYQIRLYDQSDASNIMSVYNGTTPVLSLIHI